MSQNLGLRHTSLEAQERNPSRIIWLNRIPFGRKYLRPWFGVWRRRAREKSWRTHQNIRPPSSLGTHIRFRLLTRKFPQKIFISTKKNQSFTFIPCEEVSSLYWVPWRRWRQLRWRFQAYPHGLWLLSIAPEPPLFCTVPLASFFVIVLSLLLAYFSGCAIWIKLFSFVFHPFLVFLIYYCLCNVSGTFVAFKPRFYKTMKRKLWWKSLLKLRLFLVKDLFWRSRIRVLVLWRLRLSSSSKESMSSLLYVFKWHTIPPLIIRLWV